ncbi:transcriptional activator [Apiospora arundinis]
MSSSSNTGKAGIIKAADDAGSMDKLAHTVLDDLLYNIVHDLLIKVHRDEKIARAATAAIRVEKLASDASDSSLTTESRPDIKAETDAAVYDEGRTLLKGNPLETTKDILCPRCHLPRLLYPTDGKGAKKPDPSIIYCKKHPYIDKPGYDIYGQTWVAQGPGRGKKKKDMEKKVETTPKTHPAQLRHPRKEAGAREVPHRGHRTGRNASRAAAQKISNGSSNGNHNGSQGDGTPPNSQKGTPLPGSRASSPKKRDSDDVDDDDDTDNDAHKKKKIKSAPNPTKKVILKTKGGSAPGPKKEKVKTSSLLSVEQKVDDDDAEGSTVEVAPKKKINKSASPAKKLKLGVSKPLLSSPGTTKNGKPAKSNGAGGGGGDDGESESSGTLSSPPVV